MEPVAVHSKLRPLRVAFLVDPLDRVSLSDVLRLATCMWGGPFCPLIPVSDTLPEAWRDEFHDPDPRDVSGGYLRFFEPDLFVETRSGQLHQAGIDRLRISPGRIFNLESLVRADEGASTLSVGVDVEAVYRHLCRTEYQFQRHDTPRLMDFDGAGDLVGEAFFEAAYGMFPAWAETTTRAAYRSLGPETAAPTAAAWRVIESERRSCPLDYASHGIRATYSYLPRFLAPPLSLFVFDPCAAVDVIDFWNIRQFVPYVRPVNVHWLEESRVTVIEMLDAAASRPGRRAPGFHAAVHLARSIDAVSAKEVLDLPAKLSRDVLTWEHYEAIWDPPEEHRPRMALLSARRAESELVPREGSTPFVRVPVLEPDFTVERRLGGPAWANVMRKSFHGSDHRFVTAVPSAALDQRMVPGMHGQYPSREGDVLLHEPFLGGSYHDLYLPTMNDAVAKWLMAQSCDVARSHAGRIAEQIIEAVGGLRGTSIIRRLETVKLLDSMAGARVELGGGASVEYPDRTATVGQVREGLGSGEAGEVALERLVEAGALRLGAAVPCPHCEEENWYGLDDIATIVNCGRCLRDFRFPQGFPSKQIWRYRVAGVFATPNFAEGGYSVALALATLSRSGLGGFEDPLTFSTGVEMTRDGKKLEADFVAWHGQTLLYPTIHGPTTLVGECKSFARDAFSGEDVVKLKALAGWLPGSRLVAGCTKPSLEPDEKQRLAELARWGWGCGDSRASQSPLIVLTGDELFAHDLRDTWRERGGRRADLVNDLRSMDSLAIATQELHLGLERDAILTMATRMPR